MFCKKGILKLIYLTIEHIFINVHIQSMVHLGDPSLMYNMQALYHRVRLCPLQYNDHIKGKLWIGNGPF